MFVGGRREQLGEQVVRDIRAAGGEAFFIQMDVTNEESISQAIEVIVSRYGRLDLAVNNAGVVLEQAPLANSDKELFSNTMQTNVLGVYLSMKHEIQQMLKNGGGSIVNTSSVAGIKVFAANSAYVASKYAVEGLSKSAALDYANQDIRINTVAPGPTRTETMENDEALLNSYSEMSPSKRVGTPKVISKGIAWLLSDEASYVTGTTLTIDGGTSAG